MVDTVSVGAIKDSTELILLRVVDSKTDDESWTFFVGDDSNTAKDDTIGDEASRVSERSGDKAVLTGDVGSMDDAERRIFVVGDIPVAEIII